MNFFLEIKKKLMRARSEAEAGDDVLRKPQNRMLKIVSVGSYS
jgi:hypothetical protein